MSGMEIRYSARNSISKQMAGAGSATASETGTVSEAVSKAEVSECRSFLGFIGIMSKLCKQL